MSSELKRLERDAKLDSAEALDSALHERLLVVARPLHVDSLSVEHCTLKERVQDMLTSPFDYLVSQSWLHLQAQRRLSAINSG